MQVLKESFPRLSRVAVIRDLMAAPTDLQAAETAGRALGFQLQVLEVRTAYDFESALAAAKQGRAQVLTVPPSGLFYAHRARLVHLAAKSGLPALYDNREFVSAGGLMSYGPSFPDLFRRAAELVDKILRGAKPADIPVEQPTKFELVINLKTAKALGLTIPAVVLARADEVIEEWTPTEKGHGPESRRPAARPRDDVDRGWRSGGDHRNPGRRHLPNPPDRIRLIKKLRRRAHGLSTDNPWGRAQHLERLVEAMERLPGASRKQSPRRRMTDAMAFERGDVR